MNQVKPSQWLIAFFLSFFAVGVPYWMIPYSKVNLPSSMMAPGLLMVVFTALWIRMEGASLWRSVTHVGSSVSAVVFVRVAVETTNDPTSHNLWPFEIIIALLLGFSWALAGAISGSLGLALLARRGKDGKP